MFIFCLPTIKKWLNARKNLVVCGVGCKSYQQMLIILLKKWSKVVDFDFGGCYNGIEIKKE